MYWRDEIDARREKMDRTGQPFFEQTLALFDAVNSLRLDELRELVDDDYGIMDVDPAGETVVIESKAEWDEYMVRNFAAMEAAGARLETEVLGYHGEEADTLGYSVVRFRQTVGVGAQTQHNYCVATVVWKLADDGWKEARWHCSLERVEVDEGG